MNMIDEPQQRTSREKLLARHRRYNQSDAGRERNASYDRAPKGRARKLRYEIQRAARLGYEPYLRTAALGELTEYLASGSDLPFLQWLNETYPLPRLRPLAEVDAADRGAEAARLRLLESHRRYNASPKGRARYANYKARKISAGLCETGCGRPLATADGWRCNQCLDKKITPEKLLRNRRKGALRRRAARAAARGVVWGQRP
jgi:hypothetical protein